MDKNTFGNYIRQKRTEQQMTQQQLAEQLFIDATAVSKWERGVTYPDITMIPALCRALQVNERELIECSNDEDYRHAKEEAKRYKRLKNVTFFVTVGCYLAAILTCFIVNLAVEGGLSWFFTVAVACLCGFCFFPSCLRFFKKHRLAIYAGTTLLSCCLLYLTVALYTGGRWAGVASAGTLLGYFAVFFLPLYLKGVGNGSVLRRFSLFFYGSGLLLLTLVLLLCIHEFCGMPLVPATPFAGYGFTVLLAYGLVALLPIRRMLRVGIDAFLTGGYLYGLCGVLCRYLEPGSDCYRIDFTDWVACSNGNSVLIGVLLCAVIGCALTIVGLATKRNPR